VHDEEGVALDLAEVSARLAGLLEHYLAHGCPCLFPRFRAHQERDGAIVGAPGWTTYEQQHLIALFDRSVPLKPIRGAVSAASCANCGARVERWAHEPVRDCAIEYIRFRPRPGSRDVGAPLELPVPRLLDFYAVGPTSAGAAAAVTMQWPRRAPDDWFAWMRALR
jgi:hypothetical protein